MHYSNAKSIVDRLQANKEATVDFLSPIVSTMLAASKVNGADVGKISFNDQSKGYAETSGLLGCLQEGKSNPGNLHGVTYSQVTQLALDSDVEHCNQIVCELIHTQLAGYGADIASELCCVVGELHDNVASHANGAGFSAAQMYCKNDQCRIEFAIVDAGCGMLKNVRSLNGECNCHKDAIEWCLQKGNTTGKVDDWAQRMPEDCLASPYPDSIDTRTTDNNHLGLGLWKLTELVTVTGGGMWICSGDGQAVIRNGKPRLWNASRGWNGLAIEIDIPITESESTDDEQHASLAAELGIE